MLDAVFVSPGHRGRGYTAQLMERLLSEGKDLCLSYPGRAGTPPHLSSTSVVFSSTPFIAVSTSMLIVAIKLTAKRGMLRERICMLLVGKRVGQGSDTAFFFYSAISISYTGVAISEKINFRTEVKSRDPSKLFLELL